MNTLRLKAENSAKAFYQRRQNETVEALAGDGVGNLNVTGRLQWIYVRMSGDATKVSQAYNRSAFAFAENDSIALRWVKRTGMGFYQVEGYSGSAVYDVFGAGSGSGTGTGLAAHAWQHERMNAGQGGFDPLDIFARMVVPLRARPQTVPDDTLYVEAGYNPLTGNYFAGGNSASFFPVPGTAGQARIDLLYLGTDDALHIVAGTPVGGGVTPTLPAVVVPSVPLAFVYLANAQLTIVEANIYMDPGILRAPVIPAGGSGHTIQDEGSDMPAEAHLNFVGAGVTVTDDPGNTATVVTIPGGGSLVFNVADYGAVGDGMANDTAAVQATINAAAASDGTVFFPPGVFLCDNLTYTANLNILGSGMEVSVIQANSGGSLITFAAAAGPSGRIVNITLDGDTTGAVGLDLTDLGLFHFDWMRVEGFTSIGVKLRGAVIGQFYRCVISHNATGIDADVHLGNAANLIKILDTQIENGTAFGIHWVGGSMVILDGCDIERNGTAGNAATGSIYYQSPATGDNIGIKLVNCWFESTNGKAALWIDTPPATNIYALVEDTLFSASIGSTYGIYVNGTVRTNTIVCRNVEFWSNAVTADFYADGANAVIERHYCIGTTGGVGTINSYPPYGSGTVTQVDTGTGLTGGPITTTGTISASLGSPTDVGSANADGAATTLPRSNHVHKGVHSLAKSGDAAIYGDATLTGTGGIILTEAGQNIAIDGSGISGATFKELLVDDNSGILFDDSGDVIYADG